MDSDLNYGNSNQKRLLNIMIGVPVLLFILFIFIYSLLDMEAIFSSLISPLELGKKFYWHINNYMVHPLYYIGMPLVFILQWLWPVDRKQKQFGTATRVDILFTLAMIGVYVLVAPVFLSFLKILAVNYIPVIEINIFRELPAILQYIVGYLAIDFIGWFHHVVRHKVPIFWQFHAVHHAQRELNPFSNERLHIFDWAIVQIIRFIPAFFFTESLGIILNYIAIHMILDHLNHANVRTNLGPLRYIFVTPQSHRVHHSNKKEYVDTNFGVSLSIWDHIFGTQCRNYDIYPTTGISDTDYPYEQKPGVINELKSFLQQQIYPFRKIYRELSGQVHLR